MDYDHLIKNWHTKAWNGDYFSKFVFEYLAFIAFLKKKKFISARNDRLAIQQLKRDEAVRNRYLQKIRDNQGLRKAWKKIDVELRKAPLGNVSIQYDDVEEIKWWNVSKNDWRDETIEESERIKGILHGLEDWTNMVEFWYSIRNNLFHGSKNPQDTRDQFLVENGYKTLRPLVEIFLSEIS